MCVWELDMVLQVLNVTYFITNTVIRMPGKMHTCGLACLSVNCQASSTVKNAKGMNGLLPGGTKYPVHLQKTLVVPRPTSF